MENQLTVSCVVLKDTICKNQKAILLENIRYPQFDNSSENKKAKNLCSKMNKFYKALAKQFSDYVHTNLAKKASRKANTLAKPYGAVMNYCISFDDGETVSVVVDISVFDGDSFSSGRTSHNWSVSRCALMPVSFYLDKHKKSRNYIKSLAFETLEKNLQNSSFGYFADCKKQFLHHFDINNFYFVPNGIAFFIDAGIISNVKNGPSVFIISYKQADGVLKVVPLLKNNAQNDRIWLYIVNNLKTFVFFYFCMRLNVV